MNYAEQNVAMKYLRQRLPVAKLTSRPAGDGNYKIDVHFEIRQLADIQKLFGADLNEEAQFEHEPL